VQGSPGLLARYSWLDDAKTNWKVEELLDQDFGDEPPYPPSEGWGRDEWSVTLTGYLYVPHAAEYDLIMTADDHFSVWINKGDLAMGDYPTASPAAPGSDWVHVIDEPCFVGCAERAVTGTLTLAQGWHALHVYYYDVSNEGAFKLEWQTTDATTVPRSVIPSRCVRSVCSARARDPSASPSGG
jgi:hypothetical protein